MKALSFSCPLPPPECHQNARVDKFERNKATQAYRRDVALCFIEATQFTRMVPIDPARLSLTFIVPDNRRRDVLNYAGAFKAGVDALVDVGIIYDDSWQHLSIGSISMAMNKGAPPCVLVRLEVVEEE
jgi:Holliday junction resolvase RusA-like endonuclease